MLDNYRRVCGIGKKGQEGMTLTTLLLIIIGLVVAVVIILGATGILGDFFGARDILPGQQLEVIAQSCKLAGEASLIADYCLEFKELDKNDFVNCDDPRVKVAMGDVRIDINCNDNQISPQVEVKKVEICAQASDRKRNETEINSVTCETLGYATAGQFKTCGQIPVQVNKQERWVSPLSPGPNNDAFDTTQEIRARCTGTALGGTDRTESLKGTQDYVSQVSNKPVDGKDVCCLWPENVDFFPSS